MGKLLQLDRETLIKSFTNKFEDVGKLKSKVKKWKSKYSTLDKRKKELGDLNKEKDKIINIKEKNCEELAQIVQRLEANVKEKDTDIQTLKAYFEESKITRKASQTHEEQKQHEKNI